ncbi:MAG: hypothetical protein SXA11_11890 [Cyanobacteriota bacterium]|nr:hypothetical protein [Cyanobacteriota bacterium]
MTNHQSSNFSPAERIESLKAGALAGFCALLTFSIILWGNSFILARRFELLASLQIETWGWDVALRGAIAFIGGFLFGVTYRYIVRQDPNPQLKAGAVLAFGLVRAFGQIDLGLSSQTEKMPPISELLPLAVGGIESIILFAAAGVMLELAIAKGIIKPFI